MISLPDHINEGLDLSLTYSLDQFEFPLFQSLYYNERAGKYILMVIPKETRDSQAAGQRNVLNRRAEFIDLYSVAGRDQFEASGRSSLRLIDNGKVKLLSTREGTVYTFATFADGEFRCLQIEDRDGVVITRQYTNDSSIQTIADEVSYAHRPAAYAGLTGAASVKHTPSNAIKPTYTEAMAASDSESRRDIWRTGRSRRGQWF